MAEFDRKPGILFGPDRKIRLLWRAVIFYVLADWLLPLALDPAFGFISGTLHVANGLTAANVAIGEIENFVIALICTAIVAWYEARRVDSYGLPIDQALSARTWEGALVGAVMAGAVLMRGAQRIRLADKAERESLPVGGVWGYGLIRELAESRLAKRLSQSRH
jgi:hypothetical protein